MLGSQQLYQSATKCFPLSRSADQLGHIDILIKYPCNNLETLEQSPEVSWIFLSAHNLIQSLD